MGSTALGWAGWTVDGRNDAIEKPFERALLVVGRGGDALDGKRVK